MKEPMVVSSPVWFSGNQDLFVMEVNILQTFGNPTVMSEDNGCELEALLPWVTSCLLDELQTDYLTFCYWRQPF